MKLSESNITIRPSKCSIGENCINYLGKVIGNGTITPNNDNDMKILNAEPPRTKKQIQSFLGLTGYYRAYVPNYASLTAELTDLIRKGKPNKIEWTSSLQDSFDKLKQLLAAKPVLHLPDLTKTFTLRTDASNTGLGAVLLQEKKGRLFPISYASRKLLDREKNYCTPEKECLAIVWAINKFYNYLYGNEFILQTDHHSLKYLNTSKFCNSRLMRWAMMLQPFKMQIEYIKGNENYEADYMSRS